MDCSRLGSSLHGDSPGKNAGVGCHALLHGIFPTQGSNPGLLNYRRSLYHLNHWGSPSSGIYTLFYNKGSEKFCNKTKYWFLFLGFPDGSVSKESICNVGDLGLIPGLGRSPGGEHGNPLQFSCLENPCGQRSLADYSPWGCKESDMTE